MSTLSQSRIIYCIDHEFIDERIVSFLEDYWSRLFPAIPEKIVIVELYEVHDDVQAAQTPPPMVGSLTFQVRTKNPTGKYMVEYDDTNRIFEVYKESSSFVCESIRKIKVRKGVMR